MHLVQYSNVIILVGTANKLTDISHRGMRERESAHS